MRMVFPHNIPTRFFDELASDMNELVGNILGEGANKTSGESHGFSPLMDVEELEASYELSLDLPGVRFDDMQIEMEEGFLKIHGTRHGKAKTEETRRRVERTFGDFSRKFRLPKDVDVNAIGADYEDGVLTIVLPKMEKKEPTKIVINHKTTGNASVQEPVDH